ncbi:MAG TPA: PAAR domain-containing protein [Thermoanaerobaculaceae bacterium]|nr:PAAR domain-containing protein [Thermoanaerobaculaceae bacterium]HRS15558.1 PAAR domain-containing protein [Thermoanaerobaculaceae bacterium]
MCAMASRISDLMLHGGPITLGAFTVLVEGLPAARVGDLFMCPQFLPTPHVGGLITWPGALTVLINGQPAARRSDIGQCALIIPNLVIGASMTVDIGPAAFTPPFPPFITIPDGTFWGPASWGVANYLGLVNFLVGINALAVINVGGIAVAIAVAGAVLVAALCVLVVPP